VGHSYTKNAPSQSHWNARRDPSRERHGDNALAAGGDTIRAVPPAVGASHILSFHVK
jgi:hypothetical protein